MKKAVLLLLIFLPLVVFPQEPVPYEPEEFSPVLRGIRRAEIISVGAFPFAFLLTSVLYDIGRYGVLTIQGDPRAEDYLPLFFSPPTKPPNTQSENIGILVSSIGLSVTIGIIDIILDSRKNE
jgi:hypothetical protein